VKPWVLGAVVFGASIGGCSPVTTAEAESSGNVEWLDQSGTPDATAALGRMADHDARAAAALARRSDPAAFQAAWSAVVRGAPWGATMIRTGLSDARRADVAASAMAHRDPRLAGFVDDLDVAVERASNSPSVHRDAPAIVLASVGPIARAAIDRRLLEPSTRNTMCMGIASTDADPIARTALTETTEAGRDAPACVDAVVAAAAVDDAVLVWVAERAETGLLGAASRERTLPCAKLGRAWAGAFATRPRETYPALTVPLGRALARCTSDLDGVVADTLRRAPATHPLIVQAIDPWADYGGALRATCATLSPLLQSKDPAAVRERASDALAHTCAAHG
jgi:hypothetical protein